MNKLINYYKTWVFDCDGVILNSNFIKTEAFYEVVLPYGKQAALDFIDYHTKNGGMSRFEKFKFLFENILNKKNFETEYKEVLLNFSLLIKEKLINCEETKGLRDIVKSIPSDARKIVVSGGMEEELKEVLEKRGIAEYFNGIYGSPEKKADILCKEREHGYLVYPAVFIGDSKLDYLCARHMDLDFVFLTQYTDMPNWCEYFEDKKEVMITNNLETYLQQLGGNI